jgi:hypothetical protein
MILNETKSETETCIRLKKHGDETRATVKLNLHQHTLH